MTTQPTPELLIEQFKARCQQAHHEPSVANILLSIYYAMATVENYNVLKGQKKQACLDLLVNWVRESNADEAAKEAATLAINTAGPALIETYMFAKNGFTEFVKANSARWFSCCVSPAPEQASPQPSVQTPSAPSSVQAPSV